MIFMQTFGFLFGLGVSLAGSGTIGCWLVTNDDRYSNQEALVAFFIMIGGNLISAASLAGGISHLF